MAFCIFSRCYGLEVVGLRYFNVFGPRQNPEGPYAAVIPCWIQGMLRGQPTVIHGDGRTCRDYCFVANVVQANLKSALSSKDNGFAINIASGSSITIEELAKVLHKTPE